MLTILFGMNLPENPPEGAISPLPEEGLASFVQTLLEFSLANSIEWPPRSEKTAQL